MDGREGLFFLLLLANRSVEAGASLQLCLRSGLQRRGCGVAVLVVAMPFSWLFLCSRGDVFLKPTARSVNSCSTPCSDGSGGGRGGCSWQVR